MDESEISRIVILQNKKRIVDRFIPAYCWTNWQIFSKIHTYEKACFCQL